MSRRFLQHATPLQLLIGFLLCYNLIWQLLPACFLHSVFPDTAENLSLSHALAWSYSKHPPLGMALFHGIQRYLNSNEWTNALGNILCLDSSLIGIYYIAKQYLPKQTALAATMLSSLSLYYLVNFAIQYNQNTIMLPFWVAIIAFTLRATEHNRLQDWLFLAVSVAAGMLAKYETIMIIGLAVIYLLCHLRKAHLPYLILCCMLALLLLTPHLLWIAHHHFETITYLFAQSDRSNASFWHVFLGALLAQPTHLLLAGLCLMACMQLGWLQHNTPNRPLSLTSPLCFFAITPWLGFVALATIVTVKAEWGFPLLLLVIPAICYHANLHSKRLKAIAITVLICHAVLLLSYSLNLFFSARTHRANWPGPALAQAAQRFWQTHYPHHTLAYIGGDEYPIYYLTAYLPQRPLMLKNNRFSDSLWINKTKFYQAGALFVRSGCHRDPSSLQSKGFAITASQCISLPQANKYRPQSLSFTLYLLPPDTSHTFRRAS